MNTEQVAKLLRLLPGKLLSQIGQATNIDYSVSRLRGDVMVKLLIFAMLRSNRLSTRVLEHFYNSPLFSAFSGKGGHQTRHSSLADRLSSMNADYFAELFSWTSQHFAGQLAGNKLVQRVKRFDSTLCAISSALVAWGMRVGRSPQQGPAQVQVKFTVGLKHLLPTSLESFFDQEHLSEETALRKAIQRSDPQPDELVVFDLGLKSRETLRLFDQEGIRFVTPGGSKLRYEVVEEYRQIKGRKADGLCFLQDSRVYLYGGGNTLIKHPFRLIEVWVEETGERLYFLSNLWELSAMDIARAYRHRWDIEVFFRFIKQELNIKHLINRSENGVKIQLYMALITAILVIVYKNANRISSYKIAKLRFEEELLLLIMRQINNVPPSKQAPIAFNHSASPP